MRTLNDDPLDRAIDKVTFLREAFKAVGCEGCTEKFMEIGISFYHGAATILEEIRQDLDEIEDNYKRPAKAEKEE